MRLRLSCTRSCHPPVRFLRAAEPLLTRPVQALRLRQFGEARGRLGGGRGCERGRLALGGSPGNLAGRCRDDGKSVRGTKLRRFFNGGAIGYRALALESQSLLAGEEVVEDSHVLDERPKLLLSWGAVPKTIEAGMKRCESGAAKQGSQGCNEPNQRRQEDEKTFDPISVVEVHRQQFPEWIPFQKVQEAGVSEKCGRDAAGSLNPGWFLPCRPPQHEPHRKRNSEEYRPRRHTTLLSTTLPRF